MSVDVKVIVRDYDDYEPCGICGAKTGEPCTVIRERPRRVCRSEPHFYRGRDRV